LVDEGFNTAEIPRDGDRLESRQGVIRRAKPNPMAIVHRQPNMFFSSN
jgi:hypothetical protein